jgi:hypothetical protein
MIADPQGPPFITHTVGPRRYADDASVSHDPQLKSEDRSLGLCRECRVEPVRRRVGPASPQIRLPALGRLIDSG